MHNKRADKFTILAHQKKQKMFLVKWAGLGYEHCTWETQEDINDDAIISEFRRLEGVTPEEPELIEEDVSKVIDSAITVTSENAEGNPDMALLRSQLYAQTRSFQFTKFGADIPSRLNAECGPECHGLTYPLHVESVNACLMDMVNRVSRNQKELGSSQHAASLPPLLCDEYDVILPVTSGGLLLNVGEKQGGVQFLGYRQLPNNGKGPSELANLVHNVGDQIIAVNGKSAVGKTFIEVIGMLKECVTFAYIRFLSCRNKHSELSSCGSLGKLQDYLILDELLFQLTMNFNVYTLPRIQVTFFMMIFLRDAKKIDVDC